MNSYDKNKYLAFIQEIEENAIEKYQKKIGISDKDLEFYKEIQQAIERGKKLHPGPYRMNGLIDVLKEEWRKVIEEIYNITFRDENNLKSELINLVVAAIFFIQKLNKEEANHQAAMRHDP